MFGAYLSQLASAEKRRERFGFGRVFAGVHFVILVGAGGWSGGGSDGGDCMYVLLCVCVCVLILGAGFLFGCVGDGAGVGLVRWAGAPGDAALAAQRAQSEKP